MERGCVTIRVRAAPQAALISAIAQGVLGGTLDWNLIGLGAAIGVVAVIVDEVLRSTKRGILPPLAVGMGIYLPGGVTALIVVFSNLVTDLLYAALDPRIKLG